MRKVIAIDFDGCLCEDAWPEIGAPHMQVIDAALQERGKGAALILWTCRNGDFLASAVEWCRERGLVFDAVNENLPERLEYYGSETRKISADEYWDDCAVHMPEPPNDPLTLEQLREMDGEAVWICDPDGSDGMWALVDLEYELCRTAKGGIAIFDTYGKTWLAYRRKLEEGET